MAFSAIKRAKKDTFFAVFFRDLGQYVDLRQHYLHLQI